MAHFGRARLANGTQSRDSIKGRLNVLLALLYQLVSVEMQGGFHRFTLVLAGVELVSVWCAISIDRNEKCGRGASRLNRDRANRNDRASWHCQHDIGL